MTDIAHVTVAAQGDMPKALNELIKFAVNAVPCITATEHQRLHDLVDHLVLSSQVTIVQADSEREKAKQELEEAKTGLLDVIDEFIVHVCNNADWLYSGELSMFDESEIQNLQNRTDRYRKAIRRLVSARDRVKELEA